MTDPVRDAVARLTWVAKISDGDPRPYQGPEDAESALVLYRADICTVLDALEGAEQRERDLLGRRDAADHEGMARKDRHDALRRELDAARAQDSGGSA